MDDPAEDGSFNLSGCALLDVTNTDLMDSKHQKLDKKNPTALLQKENLLNKSNRSKQNGTMDSTFGENSGLKPNDDILSESLFSIDVSVTEKTVAKSLESELAELNPKNSLGLQNGSFSTSGSSQYDTASPSVAESAEDTLGESSKKDILSESLFNIDVSVTEKQKMKSLESELFDLMDGVAGRKSGNDFIDETTTDCSHNQPEKTEGFAEPMKTNVESPGEKTAENADDSKAILSQSMFDINVSITAKSEMKSIGSELAEFGAPLSNGFAEESYLKHEELSFSLSCSTMECSQFQPEKVAEKSINGLESESEMTAGNDIPHDDASEEAESKENDVKLIETENIVSSSITKIDLKPTEMEKAAETSLDVTISHVQTQIEENDKSSATAEAKLDVQAPKIDGPAVEQIQDAHEYEETNETFHLEVTSIELTQLEENNDSDTAEASKIDVSSAVAEISTHDTKEPSTEGHLKEGINKTSALKVTSINEHKQQEESDATSADVAGIAMEQKGIEAKDSAPLGKEETSFSLEVTSFIERSQLEETFKSSTNAKPSADVANFEMEYDSSAIQVTSTEPMQLEKTDESSANPKPFADFADIAMKQKQMEAEDSSAVHEETSFSLEVTSIIGPSQMEEKLATTKPSNVANINSLEQGRMEAKESSGIHEETSFIYKNTSINEQMEGTESSMEANTPEDIPEMEQKQIDDSKMQDADESSFHLEVTQMDETSAEVDQPKIEVDTIAEIVEQEKSEEIKEVTQVEEDNKTSATIEAFEKSEMEDIPSGDVAMEGPETSKENAQTSILLESTQQRTPTDQAKIEDPNITSESMKAIQDASGDIFVSETLPETPKEAASSEVEDPKVDVKSPSFVDSAEEARLELDNKPIKDVKKCLEFSSIPKIVIDSFDEKEDETTGDVAVAEITLTITPTDESIKASSFRGKLPLGTISEENLSEDSDMDKENAGSTPPAKLRKKLMMALSDSEYINHQFRELEKFTKLELQTIKAELMAKSELNRHLEEANETIEKLKMKLDEMICIKEENETLKIENKKIKKESESIKNKVVEEEILRVSNEARLKKREKELQSSLDESWKSLEDTQKRLAEALKVSSDDGSLHKDENDRLKKELDEEIRLNKKLRPYEELAMKRFDENLVLQQKVEDLESLLRSNEKNEVILLEKIEEMKKFEASAIEKDKKLENLIEQIEKKNQEIEILQKEMEEKSKIIENFKSNILDLEEKIKIQEEESLLRSLNEKNDVENVILLEKIEENKKLEASAVEKDKKLENLIEQIEKNNQEIEILKKEIEIKSKLIENFESTILDMEEKIKISEEQNMAYAEKEEEYKESLSALNVMIQNQDLEINRLKRRSYKIESDLSKTLKPDMMNDLSLCMSVYESPVRKMDNSVPQSPKNAETSIYLMEKTLQQNADFDECDPLNESEDQFGTPESSQIGEENFAENATMNNEIDLLEQLQSKIDYYELLVNSFNLLIDPNNPTSIEHNLDQMGKIKFDQDNFIEGILECQGENKVMRKEIEKLESEIKCKESELAKSINVIKSIDSIFNLSVESNFDQVAKLKEAFPQSNLIEAIISCKNDNEKLQNDVESLQNDNEKMLSLINTINVVFNFDQNSFESNLNEFSKLKEAFPQSNLITAIFACKNENEKLQNVIKSVQSDNEKMLNLINTINAIFNFDRNSLESNFDEISKLKEVFPQSNLIEAIFACKNENERLQKMVESVQKEQIDIKNKYSYIDSINSIFNFDQDDTLESNLNRISKLKEAFPQVNLIEAIFACKNENEKMKNQILKMAALSKEMKEVKNLACDLKSSIGSQLKEAIDLFSLSSNSENVEITEIQNINLLVHEISKLCDFEDADVSTSLKMIKSHVKKNKEGIEMVLNLLNHSTDDFWNFIFEKIRSLQEELLEKFSFDEKVRKLENDLSDADDFKRKFAVELAALQPQNVNDLMKLPLIELHHKMLSSIIEKEQILIQDIKKEFEDKLQASSDLNKQIEEESKRYQLWISELENENEKINKEARLIKIENESLQKNLDQKTALCEKIKEELQEASEKLSDKKNQTCYCEKSDMLSDRFDELSSLLKQKSESCELFESRYTEASVTIKALEKLIEDKEVMIKNLRNELDSKVESESKEIKELKNTIDNQTSQMESLQNELKEAKKSKNDEKLKQEIADLTEKMKSDEKLYGNLRKNLSDDLKVKAMRIKELESKIKSTENEYKSILNLKNQECEKQQNKIKECNDFVNKLEKKHISNKEKYMKEKKKYESEIASFSTQMKEMSAKLNEVAVRIKILDEIELILTACDSDVLRILGEKLSELKNLAENLEEEKYKSAQLDQENDDMAANLKYYEKENTDYINKVSEYEKMADKFNLEIKEMALKNSRLCQELEAKNGTEEKLKNELRVQETISNQMEMKMKVYREETEKKVMNYEKMAETFAAEMKILSDKNDELKKQLKSRNERQEEFEMELKMKENLARRSEEKLKAYQADYQNILAENESFRVQIEEVNSKLIKALDNLANVHVDHSQRNKDESLQRKNVQLTDNLNVLNEKNGKLEYQVEQLKQALKQKDDTIAQYRSELENVSKQNGYRNFSLGLSRINNSGSDYENKMKACQNKMAEVEKENLVLKKLAQKRLTKINLYEERLKNLGCFSETDGTSRKPSAT